MRRHPRLLRPALLLALALLLPGCLVAPRPVVVRPSPCPGGVWVEPHYDRFGRSRHAHWQCPGARGGLVVVVP